MPKPLRPGRVIALLPPTSSVSARVALQLATASEMTGVAASMLSPSSFRSPWSAIGVNYSLPISIS
jgi:hypothetical protein